MNIDELATKIECVSSERVAQDLSRLLIDWKSTDTKVEDLRRDVERYIGNTWITSDSGHASVYRLWSQFRDNAISGIGGLTMNERLYYFGLFERFEACLSDEEKLSVYIKVHAKP